jgi:Rieske [2Fe-2S] domain
MREQLVGTVEELGPGSVRGVGNWAVINVNGERYAVSRRCRHLRADLAEGEIDDDDCLVARGTKSAMPLQAARWSSGRRPDSRNSQGSTRVHSANEALAATSG